MNSPESAGKTRAGSPWDGGTLMATGWATFAGTVGQNREHAHHALQLVIAESGDVGVWAAGRDWIRAPGILLDANMVHRLQDGPARLLFVDRESSAGRLLSLECTDGIRIFSPDERSAVLNVWPSPTCLEIAPVIAALGHRLETCALAFPDHDRVQRVLRSLLTRNDWDGSLASLAAEAALSPDRFRHRVRDLIGMPLRPYLRWLRLRQAVELAAGGTSLTQAAQDAGFSDSAHLTRTMRRHFGVAPSDVVGALRKRH